jgi:hypothetical protein
MLKMADFSCAQHGCCLQEIHSMLAVMHKVQQQRAFSACTRRCRRLVCFSSSVAAGSSAAQLLETCILFWSCRWRKELTWRCFLVSAITIVVVKYSISICVSHGHCSYLQWGSLAWCAAWRDFSNGS